MFIREKRICALTVFVFFACLMCIYFLSVSMISCTLSISPLQSIHFLRVVRVCLLRHIYLPYINLILSSIFLFSNTEGKQILGLRLIIQINVRYVTAVTCIECLTELQRSCQGMVASIFFSVSQLAGFLIDQM